MQSVPLPLGEPDRLQVVNELRLTEAEAASALDAFVQLLHLQLGAPVVAFSLFDAHGQRIGSSRGLAYPTDLIGPDDSLCLRLLSPATPMVFLADAGLQQALGTPIRAAQSPVPADLKAYAGHLLFVDGHPIGSLSAVWTQAPEWGWQAQGSLKALVKACEAWLASRLKEQRMRRQAARLRAASLSSGDWLWETDASGRVTWVSDSIVSHTGRPAEADIGLSMQEINRPCPDDHTDSWETFSQRRGHKEPFRDLITQRDTPKGRVIISISGVPVFSRGGQFRGYRGATSNITDRIDAQKAAREAEQLLHDALETLVAGVIITDPDGVIIRSNAASRRGIGLDVDGKQVNWHDKVREMTWSGDYPDAVGREEAFIHWRLHIANSGDQQHEVRWRDRWLIISARRLAGGNVVNLSIDITERKRVELALAARESELRESQQRLSSVLEAVPDLWFVLNASGEFLECSSPEHPMLAMDWDILRHQSFGSALSAELATATQTNVRLALDTGQVQRHEYALTTRDGVARWFEARVAPMPGDRVLYVTRDLTELRALERDLMLMKRAVEAAAALPLCVADATQPDMPLVYVNPAFETLTGYTQSELLGQNCRVLQGQRTDQPALELIRQALAERREVSVTLNNRRKDGSVFTNSLHIAPVFDGSGAATHWIGVLHDVTEQTRAADKLRLSEELYRSVASAISDGLLVLTPQLKVIAINNAGAQVLGVASDELTRSTSPWPFEFLNEDRTPLKPADHPVTRVVHTGAPSVRQVLLLRRPDQQFRWIEVSAHPLQLRPEGNTFSVVLTFRDITKQRAAELALVAAEERWKFALEGSGDGVWDWSVESGRVFYSARWKKMFGFSEEEIGDALEEWTSRIHPEDRAHVTDELQRHLRGGTAVYQSEHRIRHRDGRWLWILDRGKAVHHDPEGRPLRIVGTHSDITSSKQAEQALRDKQAAELASRAKSQFLSRMSHEMRTPLNAVIGFAQLMSMRPHHSTQPAQVLNYAEHILTAGQHLLALINDVLDLQKVEEGGLALSIGPLSLDDLLTRTLELLQPAAQERRVKLDNLVRKGIWVRADAQRLRQVLINIASNAIKYNREGGVVRFSVTQPDQRAILCIEDTGSGMTESQMNRLFQPFERLGRETSSIEGTGLGLIIARSLTHALGGRLEVSSQPGQGTRVSIDLQREDAPNTHTETLFPMDEGLDKVTDSHAPLRMLYVEDNRINAILFEGALRMNHSTVDLRVAEDGEEALLLAAEWQPEVLVLDAHLPGMSGFDVLKQLRQLPGLADAPAYMCSADAMPEDVQRAYKAGFIGYWTKPIDIAAVLSDIELLVQRLRSTTSTT